MVTQALKHKFTVDDFYRMGETHILQENERYELIEGEIIYMSPPGSVHAGIVTWFNQFFSAKLGNKAFINVQNPLRLDQYSEPEPDIVLLKPRDDFYTRQHPTAQDALLVIEISDSTLHYDRKTKMHLYAKHNILESWIVNVSDRTFEVYRTPTANGYQDVSTISSDQSISPIAFSEIVVPLTELFSLIKD